MTRHPTHQGSINKAWRALASRCRRWCALAAAAFGVALLAGCYAFEPGTAVLDAGSSRIPLALHGEWVVEGKQGGAHIVIESSDGRIGHYYLVVGEGKERSIKLHFPILMARAGEGVYLMGRLMVPSPTQDAQIVIPIRFDGATWQQLKRRNTAGDETQADADAKEAAVARKLALKLGGGKDDSYFVRGAVSLESMKRFVGDAFSDGLFKDGTVYKEEVYRRRPGMRLIYEPNAVSFAMLRARQQALEDKALAELEALRRNAGSSADITLRLDAWGKQDGADSVLATAEGTLLHAEIQARSTELSPEQRASLELSARSGAAALGHTESQLWMALRFEARTSNPLDALNSAWRWYELAAAGGSPEGVAGAKRVRGKLAAQGLR